MKNQTKSNLKRYLTAFAISLFAFLFAAQVEVLAQDKAKIGDRVNSSMDGGKEKGTIKEIGKGDYKDCFFVLWDYQKNTGSKGTWSCTHGQKGSLFILDATDKRVRDINDGVEKEAEKQVETPPVKNENNQQKSETTKPHNAGMPALCGGELLLSPKLKGRTASVALFTDVIKSLWDKDKDSKGWGRRVTNVENLIIGAAYRWRPGIDLQLLGTKPKSVYPVKVKYTTCEEQMLEWRQTETTTEEVYSCYIEDQFGMWTCSIRQAAEFKKTYFDKPEKKKITGEE